MNDGFIRKTSNGVPYYVCTRLNDTGLAMCAFSTRIGGVSPKPYDTLNLGRIVGNERENVLRNREIFAQAIGLQSGFFRYAQQEHGDRIFVVSRMTDFPPEGAVFDGFITNLPDVPLMVFTADCLPVLLLDPVKRVVAAVHCGWRGTALDIAGKAVRLMVSDYGSHPADIIAAFGPCIMPCHFLTDGDVPVAMLGRYGKGIESLIQPKGEKFSVDLPGINVFALEREGLNRQNIHLSGLCSVCRNDEFYSHRLTGFERGVCAGIISLI